MKRKSEKIHPEWSYLVPAEDIELTPSRLEISAGEEERASVARRLGIIGIDDLRADLQISRDRNDHIIHVYGTLLADIIQECVVTLEPVKTHVEENFEGWFADNDKTVSFAKARRDRLKVKTGIDVPVLEEQEDPEPIDEGMIDIGELVVQNLSLAMPEYPHKEGVVYETSDEDKGKVEKSELRKNPFAALKDWKK